ncbi:MAG: TIGR04438 family Trp-rich protein [Burkholderiaceae bacterium]|nr:TIGR04438 family Trp-rich protein [Burkholderiaceae bacterium]
MWLVLIGVFLSLLKMADVQPFAAWDWLLVLSPFALAAIWWTIADRTGYTKRKAQERMDAKRDARRQRSMEELGLVNKKKK